MEAGNTVYCSQNGVLFNIDKTILLQYPAGKTDKSYTIPDGVKSIEAGAFVDCSALTEITIPSSITSIGAYAFLDCSALTQVTVLSTTPPTLGNNVFRDTNADLTIYVPYSKVEDYKGTANWSTYANKIQGLTATVTKAPTAIDGLVFDNTPKDLVVAGEAENGKMVYSLSQDGTYTETLKVTDAKEYTVYYKAQGDGTIYGDSEVKSVMVSIAKAQIDMTNVAWDYTDPFTYDGYEKTVTVKDVPIGVTAGYSGDLTKTEVGSYTATVSFVVIDAANYELVNTPEDIESLSWSIAPAAITGNVTIDGNAVYGKTLEA